DAVKALGKIDISVLFVPAAGVKDAAISAIDAGTTLTVLVPDLVPIWDAMEIAAAAKANGATFLGPNTLGVLSPGKGVVGMIGGRAESARSWFKAGIPKGVGVISRSGGMASSTGYYLGQAGVRISTIAHIGGDAVLGIRIPDAALMFEADPFTEAIVIFGEIGSSQEEELSQLIRDRKVTKPVIAYIGGKAAREGTREGLFEEDTRTVLGSDGPGDGRDPRTLNRSWRDAAKRAGRANRRVDWCIVKRSGRRRHHVH